MAVITYSLTTKNGSSILEQEYFKVQCIDILVNNAGINMNLGWKKCMDVNIMGVMMGTEMAVDRMVKSGKYLTLAG